jgi:hypothetical protein
MVSTEAALYLPKYLLNKCYLHFRITGQDSALRVDISTGQDASLRRGTRLRAVSAGSHTHSPEIKARRYWNAYQFILRSVLWSFSSSIFTGHRPQNSPGSAGSNEVTSISSFITQSIRLRLDGFVSHSCAHHKTRGVRLFRLRVRLITQSFVSFYPLPSFVSTFTSVTLNGMS